MRYVGGRRNTHVQPSSTGDFGFMFGSSPWQCSETMWCWDFNSVLPYAKYTLQPVKFSLQLQAPVSQEALGAVQRTTICMSTGLSFHPCLERKGFIWLVT